MRTEYNKTAIFIQCKNLCSNTKHQVLHLTAFFVQYIYAYQTKLYVFWAKL